MLNFFQYEMLMSIKQFNACNWNILFHFIDNIWLILTDAGVQNTDDGDSMKSGKQVYY